MSIITFNAPTNNNENKIIGYLKYFLEKIYKSIPSMLEHYKGDDHFQAVVKKHLKLIKKKQEIKQ